jgi:hypothetical protein
MSTLLRSIGLHLPTTAAIDIKPAIACLQRGADRRRPVMRRCGVPALDDSRASSRSAALVRAAACSHAKCPRRQCGVPPMAYRFRIHSNESRRAAATLGVGFGSALNFQDIHDLTLLHFEDVPHRQGYRVRLHSARGRSRSQRFAIRGDVPSSQFQQLANPWLHCPIHHCLDRGSALMKSAQSQ